MGRMMALTNVVFPVGLLNSSLADLKRNGRGQSTPLTYIVCAPGN